MNNLINQINAANPQALDSTVSYVWDIHACKFGAQSKAAKDAAQLAAKIAATHNCEFDIYGVFGCIGRTQHSKSEVVLVVLPKGVELDRACRQYVHLESVRNAA